LKPIQVIINGLPGNVASVIALYAMKDPRINLLPYSLTGPEIEEDRVQLSGKTVELIKPDEREKLEEAGTRFGKFISVDFTHPSAVNTNASFYCDHGMPFVMGTTGGDREELVSIVKKSNICAVIAPNMAKQIVGFQAMMAHAAETFPGIFKGYTLSVKESHQAGKADTSGTAKAMVSYFNQMGIEYSTSDIRMERDPQVQKEAWKIPEAYLSGHGWHTYRLTSPDKTVTFEFQHNVNGREIYAEGTIDAICYLDRKCGEKHKGRVFSMIDVLKG
jgi:4-hydroxy-tetrahydrodipicolinate reductase